MSRRPPFDEAQVRECLAAWSELDIGALQVAVYVAAGGGYIGRLYAEQPAEAYVDDRVPKRPYSAWKLERMRRTLEIAAEVRGLDPRNLPPMPQLHNCGVF